MLGSLHSDSNHQMDNTCTQPLASSTCCASAYPLSHSLLLHASSAIKHPSTSTAICKVSSFILHADFQAYSASPVPSVNSFFSFQMVALNFECILRMLKDGGTIPRDTLCSQDGINLGDIHFCPMLHTLHMHFSRCPAHPPL